MAPLCAEFGISRKTGYKIFTRYKDCGVQAFTDRSRRAYRQANRLPAQIEAVIVHLKREYPGWGAPKIREKLRRQFTGPHLPAISTVHAVLDRHGLVHRRRRRRHAARGTGLSQPTEANALWCADYKGEFMLANRRYCYPLTITDFASRYLLTCEALATTQAQYAFTVFERTFKEFGLPQTIRTDNGVPFASGHALYGLSTLSVWWLRLGIQLERIQPGHPQQNGRHERMHRTLKTEATKPAAPNVLQQQARFDDFITCFNQDRPHQALGMKVPADVYTRSPRVYRGLEELTYPFHDATYTAGWVEYKLLRRGMNQRIGDTGLPASLSVKLWSCAALAAAAALGLKVAFPGLHRILAAVVVLGGFGLVYLGAAMLIKVPESRILVRRLRR